MTRSIWGAFVLSVVVAGVAAAGDVVAGRVEDAYSGLPVPGAFVTTGERVVETDAAGRFEIEPETRKLAVRAPGYRRVEVEPGDELVICLMPFSPRALYLSYHGIGHRGLREEALRLIESTELNALVIDTKGDHGLLPYRSRVPAAREIGADKVPTLRDLPGLLDSLKARGIYTIARIVVFKDDVLAAARPDLAVKLAGHEGELWVDHEGLRWTDPFRREVWDYNIALADEAAELGFDEIQFDYVRFPEANGLCFSHPTVTGNRVAAIRDFLAEARRRLAPRNVFVAADLFGYACWNPNDTGIGHRLEDLAPLLDYVSPMLYPSGFQFGIPGLENPLDSPFEIVRQSLEQARARTGLPPHRFRPWLQAFRDYAFDRRVFGPEQIRDQIRAAEGFGARGWMLWNPRNVYSEEIWNTPADAQDPEEQPGPR